MELQDKKYRILDIFFRLLKGEFVSVKQLADEYAVSGKTVSRDLNEIKAYLSENGYRVANTQIEYSHKEKAYYLSMDDFLSSKELLVLIEILISSRSLPKERMMEIIDKLESFTLSKDKKLIKDLILKEKYHYKPVGKDCKNTIDNVWSVSRAIQNQQMITISYYKMDRTIINRKIRPHSIIFSDYYFYLIGSHKVDNEYVNRFYRVDRITDIIKHKEKYSVDYSKRLDEGELKNQIQYMWPGRNMDILFEFNGPSVQAILDKIPESEIVKREGNKYTIKAKVYGDGIKMFLLSQGAWVKILEPAELADKMKTEIENMLKLYNK